MQFVIFCSIFVVLLASVHGDSTDLINNDKAAVLEASESPTDLLPAKNSHGIRAKRDCCGYGGCCGYCRPLAPMPTTTVNPLATTAKPKPCYGCCCGCGYGYY